MILRARDEDLARILVGDQVEIALAVFLLLVGQAVEFLRQRAQRLGQQAHLRDAHRQFAGLGLEQHADGAEDVAQVAVLEVACASSPVSSLLTKSWMRPLMS